MTLSIRYEHDGDPNDDFGWLEVSGERFSGVGSMWVQWQEFAELGEELSPFPLRTAVTYRSSFWPEDGQTVTTIDLKFSQHDARGRVAVEYDLADFHEPINRVHGKMLTTYQRLKEFSEQLRSRTDRSGFSADLLNE